MFGDSLTKGFIHASDNVTVIMNYLLSDFCSSDKSVERLYIPTVTTAEKFAGERDITVQFKYESTEVQTSPMLASGAKLVPCGYICMLAKRYQVCNNY